MWHPPPSNGHGMLDVNEGDEEGESILLSLGVELNEWLVAIDEGKVSERVTKSQQESPRLTKIILRVFFYTS